MNAVKNIVVCQATKIDWLSKIWIVYTYVGGIWGFHYNLNVYIMQIFPFLRINAGNNNVTSPRLHSVGTYRS